MKLKCFYGAIFTVLVINTASSEPNTNVTENKVETVTQNKSAKICHVSKKTLRELRDGYQDADKRVIKTMEFMKNAQIHSIDQCVDYISRARNEPMDGVKSNLIRLDARVKAELNNCSVSSLKCRIPLIELKRMYKYAESASKMGEELSDQLLSNEIQRRKSCPSAVAVAYTSIQASGLATPKLSEALNVHLKYCQ